MNSFAQIANTIRLKRIEAGKTQQCVAAEIGCSAQTIARLEQGAGEKISLQLLLRALDALGLELALKQSKRSANNG